MNPNQSEIISMIKMHEKDLTVITSPKEYREVEKIIRELYEELK